MLATDTVEQSRAVKKRCKADGWARTAASILQPRVATADAMEKGALL